MKRYIPASSFIWLLLFTIVSSAYCSGVSSADPPKPIIVVSIASVDRLMDDLAYMAKITGQPQANGFVQLLAGKFLETLDRSRPSGVIVTLADHGPKGVGFLPISDLKGLLSKLDAQFGVDVEQLDHGIKRVGIGKSVFLKQQGKWLFFSDHAENLDHLPAEPEKLLEGLHQSYDLAIRLNVRNIPESVRKLASHNLETWVELGLDPNLSTNADLDPELAEVLRKNVTQVARSLIYDTDQVTVGWAVDSQGRRSYLDVDVTAVAGTDLARRFSGLSSSATAFSGLVGSDAAISFLVSCSLSDQDIEQFTTLFEILRREGKKAIQKDADAPPELVAIFDQILSVVVATFQQGTVDTGGSVFLGPRSFQFAGGVRVANGPALAAAFKSIIELAKNEPDVPVVKFNAARHRNIAFHTFSVPIAEDEKESRKVLGDALDVVIGTGPKSVYLAFGQNGIQLLTDVIERSTKGGKQPLASVQMKVAVKRLMRFLATVSEKDEKLGILADTIEKAEGGDGISAVIQGGPQRLHGRLEIQEGVFEMLGKAVQLDK